MEHNRERMEKYFLNPPNAYRAKPFWAWNGELETQELKRQAGIMQEMGFGGYFMHSRVGLKTKYLGEQWFSHINACADEGERLGLETWLYDEDRWPSGSAGGTVTQKKENRMKFLRMNHGPFEWSEKVVCAFSCELDGINVRNVRRLKLGEQPQAGDVLWFEIVTFPESPNYNGATYLDTMKRSAVMEYIESTHEKYLSHCGSRLGTSISGIFTDEPHRGELMCNTNESGLNLSACVPYTESLFQDFRKRWGYDLANVLPQLFLRENGEVVSAVKWHFCEVLQTLFLDSFMKPIAAWCAEHQMQFTGHLLHEDTLSAQTAVNGSLMRSYELMDCPGVDVLSEQNTNYNIVIQLASVARQCGKKTLLSELDGCTGWQMDFEHYKFIGDWQALLGINLRCPHLSWYTMEGECKRDYPASIFFQSAWYRDYHVLEDYFARLAVFLEGETVCDTLVINPVESIWCQIHAGWSKWLSGVSPEALAVEEQFESLYRRLLAENVPFDYGDEEMMSRLGRIEGSSLLVGKAAYKKVVVCGLLTIRSTTKQLLEQFELAGGKVILIGAPPSFVDARPELVRLGNTPEEALYENRSVSVSHPDIFAAVKQCGTERRIMLLNVNREQAAEGEFDGPDGFYQQWNPDNGAVRPVEKPVRVRLLAGESRLFTVSPEPNSPVPEKELPWIRLGEPDGYRLSEPNVLVLDRAQCSAEGRQWSGDVLKIDRAMRDHYGLTRRGGEMYQPWYVKEKGVRQLGSFTLRYVVRSTIESEVLLVLEQARRYRIEVNSQPASGVCGYWVDPALETVKINLKRGENVIELSAVFAEDTNLEAIYLVGSFGVFDDVIGPLPEAVRLGDIRPQGFPYYGGKLAYLFRQDVKTESKLALPGLCGAACVTVNGKIIGWKPYEAVIEPCESVEVELALTRRNTFGPLHKLPAVDSFYGPDSYLSEGEQWSDKAVTLPAGLEW